MRDRDDGQTDNEGDVRAWVDERDGLPVIVTESPVKPLTVVSVRRVVERSRE